MGRLSYLNLIILAALFSQEIVASPEDNIESSSVPHSRQKRMNIPGMILQPGQPSSGSELHFDDPTEVRITQNGQPTRFIGFAVHPHFVVVHSLHVLPGFGILPFGGTTPLTIEGRFFEPNFYVAVVKVKEYISLGSPVQGALANTFSGEAISWARTKVEEKNQLESMPSSTARRYFVGQILYLQNRLWIVQADGSFQLLNSEEARRLWVEWELEPVSQESNHQPPVPLEDNDLLFRSIYPIGRARGGTIYETNPVQASRPLIITPQNGDLLLRSGAPVAKYQNNKFRPWRQQGLHTSSLSR